MTLRQRLEDLGYAAGWGLVRGMPAPLARGTFRLAADLAARRNGPGTRQYRRNLARVVPKAGAAELDRLVRDGLRSYARYWMETFRLPGMSQEQIYRQVDEVMIGKPVVDAALDRGKGLVLALPHTGNFDVSGIWLTGHAGQFTTVAERLPSDYVWRRFTEYRESLGFEILPASGTEVAPYRVLIERLRANRVVCLPADRDLSRRGVPVNFFGAETRMPAGPARLAAMTGATIMIVDSLFTEDGWGLRMHSPMLVHSREEIASATQKMADLFAADIAANPADWHMLQKLWLADLSDERRETLSAREATEPR